jgi:hypothetical protein
MKAQEENLLNYEEMNNKRSDMEGNMKKTAKKGSGQAVWD